MPPRKSYNGKPFGSDSFDQCKQNQPPPGPAKKSSNSAFGDPHLATTDGLLYDLQQVCLDNEQPIYALDLVEWLTSMGRRPMKRPLPSQLLVRLTRHLDSAKQRLTMARLSEQDRRHLSELLQNALQGCEARLRK